VLVSAGFDAHQEDPLGNMRVTAPAFAAMTGELRTVAERSAGGRLVAVVEGGYHLGALGESLRGVVRVLSAADAAPAWPSSSVRSARGATGAAAARRALSGFWKLTG
jgi:acetoin utilization deacetylase AcuC-like enzyme